MKKKWPVLKNDQDAEKFLESADLSDYDFSAMVPVPFEFAPKDKQINIRLPQGLYDAVRQEANKHGISYQKYIRKTLEDSLHQ